MLEKLITLLNGNILILTRKFEEVVAGLKNLATGFSSLSKEIKDQKPPQITIKDNSEAITKAIEAGFAGIKKEDEHEEKDQPDLCEEIKKGFAGIKIEAPNITVNPPQVNIEAPKVTVEAPKVTVQSPETIKVEGMQNILEAIKGIFSEAGPSIFKHVSKKKPIPMVMVDKDGELVDWKKLFASVQPKFVGGGVHGLTQSSSSATNPIEGYKCADIDTAGNPKYYGFISTTGAWYILQENTTAGSYRYKKGTSGYSTGWTNRVTHSYDYFSVIFA